MGRKSLKGNWIGALAGNFKKSFNLQNGNVISNKFSRHFLISNDFLPRNWKTHTNYFEAILLIGVKKYLGKILTKL